MNCGIVGLPNVGKSTVFSALTAAPAQVANYPFCTIEPNVGVVNVPDSRLDRIVFLIPTAKVIPAVTEFVDIAGLVAGASKGEGLGNRFLANIREVNIIAHVVRCFDDSDIIHVNNKTDPAGDISTIDIELALADLETVQKRYDKQSRLSRVSAKDARDNAVLLPLYERLLSVLQDGKPASSAVETEEEKALLSDLHLITLKPVIFVANVDEKGLVSSTYANEVKELAQSRGCPVVVICGKAEAEIAQMDEAERPEFLQALGLQESGMNQLIRTAYSTLGLRTFFTAGPDEDRAWTFKAGSKAPQAAGVIHTDFEKGFIRAEVYSCEDLFEYGSEAAVREHGKLRLEGKDYVVQDGDIMHFRFNV